MSSFKFHFIHFFFPQLQFCFKNGNKLSAVIAFINVWDVLSNCLELDGYALRPSVYMKLLNEYSVRAHRGHTHNHFVFTLFGSAIIAWDSRATLSRWRLSEKVCAVVGGPAKKWTNNAELKYNCWNFTFFYKKLIISLWTTRRIEIDWCLNAETHWLIYEAQENLWFSICLLTAVFFVFRCCRWESSDDQRFFRWFTRSICIFFSHFDRRKLISLSPACV